MKPTTCIAALFAALLASAAPLAAQAPPADPAPGPAPTAQEEEKSDPPDGRTITMQHFRPLDQRGVNMFETPKEPGVEYTASRSTSARGSPPRSSGSITRTPRFPSC